ESLAIFLISSMLYAPFFRKIKLKNVFIVSRDVFKSALYVAHKNKCKGFEFQHGITQSETALYSGIYQKEYDPQVFLVFGEAWVNDFYGIPKEQIINIGWAYKDYVKEALSQPEKNNENTFLVISSPAITDA